MINSPMANRAYREGIHVQRQIGHIQGSQPGPTLIFTAGLHGNEPSGVLALNEVMKSFIGNEHLVKGDFYGLSGNIPALEVAERYIDEDLNRLWTRQQMDRLDTLQPETVEYSEQQQLWKTIRKILATADGPVYFFDLHTTSCESVPFININDTILNRIFAQQYPVPMILGIEEHLQGPMLSYINELGYIAIGFEGGQHDDPQSVTNHINFISLTLELTGAIRPEDQPGNYRDHLREACGHIKGIFEIFHHHPVNSSDHFRMKGGFMNFELVRKGAIVAINNRKPVKLPQKGRMFMPLYQDQGEDGFFIVRPIPRFFLWLSKWLRPSNSPAWLTLLPGVTYQNAYREVLVVNKRIARFFTRDFFHLLGYRIEFDSDLYMLMRNRETSFNKKLYSYTPWYRKKA